MDRPDLIVGQQRHHDRREHRFAIATPLADDPTLVRCPVCSRMAAIHPQHDHAVQLTCIGCGAVRRHDGKRRSFDWHGDNPTDGYFGLPLWLQTDCCGHALWAYNRRHLTFLEEYATATLRQRSRNEYGWANASLASRLPKWIKAAGNRTAIIRALARLRQMAGK